MYKNLLFIIAVIIVFICHGLSVHVEAVQKQYEDFAFTDFYMEDIEIYQFPDIKPEIKIDLGAQFAERKGSERVFEYKYLNDSPVFAGEMRLFKYPHRMYLELNMNDRKDYFGDGRYAYESRVLSRWLHTSLYHNLDNIGLIDLDVSTSSPGIDIRDSDVQYGVKTGINRFYLRLKTPDYPFHIYFKGFHVDRNGIEQQRNMMGSGWFNDILRVTQSRDINWQTDTYITGMNSHLGPVEVEFFHTEKKFSVKGDEVIFDAYTANMYRSDGVFPHNEIPRQQSSANTVKIHTSLTGKLVASTTLSMQENNNTTSGVKADIFNGSGSIRWMPITKLLFSLQYTHRDLDADNPDTATITDISDPSHTYTFDVKPPVSATIDTIYLTGVYRLIPGTTLRSSYSYREAERANAGLWNLQDSTRKNSMFLSAHTRALKNVEMNAQYVYSHVENPSYNTEPDHSHQGLASISWLPSPGINLFVSYSITEEERDDLRFSETEMAEERDVRLDNVLGSGTVQIMNNLSLTTSYAYMRYKVRQDIVYHTLTGVPLTDTGVPLEEVARVYSAALHYVPKDNIRLLARISHTRSSGEFRPHSEALVSPVSIASFSRHNVHEIVYHLSGDYEIRDGFSCGLDFTYKDFDDILDNIHNNEEDGDAHIILLKISKRWG